VLCAAGEARITPRWQGKHAGSTVSCIPVLAPKGGAGSLGSYATLTLGCTCTRWPAARCLAGSGRSAYVLRGQGLSNSQRSSRPFRNLPACGALAATRRRGGVPPWHRPSASMPVNSSSAHLRSAARQLSPAPAIQTQLRDGTCDERGIAHRWDVITTRIHPGWEVAPAAAHLGDLVLA
jgi:hypothetical protein